MKDMKRNKDTHAKLLQEKREEKKLGNVSPARQNK